MNHQMNAVILNGHFTAVIKALTPFESNDPGLALNFTVFRRARSFLSTLPSKEPCQSLTTEMKCNHSHICWTKERFGNSEVMMNVKQAVPPIRGLYPLKAAFVDWLHHSAATRMSRSGPDEGDVKRRSQSQSLLHLWCQPGVTVFIATVHTLTQIILISTGNKANEKNHLLLHV